MNDYFLRHLYLANKLYILYNIVHLYAVDYDGWKKDLVRGCASPLLTAVSNLCTSV